ncbi:hypothetical protein [Nocardia africana]|uniref:Uncharacterized protein n=1 Tax=Nocardia africana TaxID=134964 RepID=A0ABW6N9X3_9NOCA
MKRTLFTHLGEPLFGAKKGRSVDRKGDRQLGVDRRVKPGADNSATSTQDESGSLEIGSSLGTAIAGTILVAGLSSPAYATAMLTLAAAAVIGLLAAAALPHDTRAGNRDHGVTERR